MNKCHDCGIEISPRSKRCVKCRSNHIRSTAKPASENCPRCGAKITIKEGESTGNFRNRRFCNVRCAYESRRKDPGEPSKLSRERSARHVAAEAKSDVAECEMCGSTKRLHVHHRDENPLNNALDNLLKVCVRCHMRIHGPHWSDDGLRRRSCTHPGCEKPRYRTYLCRHHHYLLHEKEKMRRQYRESRDRA